MKKNIFKNVLYLLRTWNQPDIVHKIQEIVELRLLWLVPANKTQIYFIETIMKT